MKRFVKLLVVLIAAIPATGFVGATDPLVVLPGSDLSDGQLVQLEQSVSVPRSIIDVGVTVESCLTEWTGSRPCEMSTVSPFFTSNLDEGRVARFIESGDGTVIDCASADCSIVYTETACVNNGQPFGTCAFVESVAVETPVTFADEPGAGTIGFWNDGDEIRVIGTDMTGAEPGTPATAAAFQCAFLSAGGLACGGGVGAAETDFDGEYDETLTMQKVFSDNGNDADCSRDICVVAVVVFADDGSVIDVQAARRDFGQETGF